MKISKLAGGLAGVFAGALLATAFAMPASAAEVTAERLANPEPENWLHNNQTYDSNRFSRLDQINKSNIGDLRLAFTVAIGGLEGGGNWPYGSLQGTPLVDGGFMYAIDGWGTVYKIDVRDGRSGKIVWVMDPGVDKADVWLPANRGVALAGNRVISVTGDSRVIATNADTGEVIWDIDVAVTEADSLTGAPLVVGNKILIGGSGGDRGARSWLLAMDSTTGRETVAHVHHPGARRAWQ